MALRELGFVPVEAANLRAVDGLFAGPDAVRLAGFHELAADPAIRAIWFARGGHGALRLLPHLDWQLLAQHPRVYIGYSDLTPLLLQVVQRLGLVSFHGPMVAVELARGLDPAERTSLLAALCHQLPLRLELESGNRPDAARPDAPSPEEPISGRLLGGCLSLLVATLGTPWAPDLENALLFLEDVSEPLYRFDRMLTHFDLSGRLSRIRGLIAGHLSGPSGTRSRSLEQALVQLAVRLGTPCAWGLAAGHQAPNFTLPLGALASLDLRARQLVILPDG